MNVLEKILEEIEDVRKIMKSTVATNCFGKECENDDCTVCVCERVIDIIRSHMDEAKNDGWIPCSERLPNEIEFQEAYCRNQYAAEFLVTIKGATRPTTLYFKNNSWFDEQRNYYKVVAWQPLPASYKGEEVAG
ncbi:putative uncharacterized protein [Lachnospiraceae bacterium CAG:364]|nr:putative uncharacterized protein [Lachnospiraceae bacterium CAG:364]